MADVPPIDFMLRRLVLVRCAEWYCKTNWTRAGEASFHWYLGTVDSSDGHADIFRYVKTEHLEAERAMIAEHNRRIDVCGDASAGAAEKYIASHPKTVEDQTIDQGRKKAMLNRGGPSPLFKGS